jgi:hypothetical protein
MRLMIGTHFVIFAVKLDFVDFLWIICYIVLAVAAPDGGTIFP